MGELRWLVAELLEAKTYNQPLRNSKLKVLLEEPAAEAANQPILSSTKTKSKLFILISERIDGIKMYYNSKVV